MVTQTTKSAGAATDSRTWVHALCLAALLLCIVEVSGATVRREVSPPVRVRIFGYDENRRLIVVPGMSGKDLLDFRYGEPMAVETMDSSAFGGLDPERIVSDTAVPDAETGNALPPHPPRTYEVGHWTSDHGLPETKVRALAQTRDGYLWVGTANGAARFDGVRFTSIHLPNGSDATNQPSIRSFCEDAEGRVWIGTRTGLYRWSGGRTAEALWTDDLGRLSIHGIVRRRAGGIWVATSSGAGYVDGSVFRKLSAVGSEPVLCLAEMPEGILWVGGEDGLAQISLDQDRVTRRVRTWPVGGHDGPLRNRILGLLRDRKGRLWIGSALGIWRMDSSGAEPRAIHDAGTTSYARLAADARGTIWASSEHMAVGVFPTVTRLGEDGERPQTIGIKNSLEGGMCLVCDREGVVWVGGKAGLFCLKQRPLSTLALGDAGLLGSGVESVGTVGFGMRGDLWFSTRWRWAHWTGDQLDLGHQLLPPAIPHFEKRLAALFLPLVSGKGTPHSPGLRPYFVNHSDQIPTSFSLFESIPITALEPSGDGRQWVSTSSGLFRVSSTGAAERICPAPGSTILALAEDPESGLWIGTAAQGLYRWDGRSLNAVPDSQNGSYAISALLPDEDGDLWLGTSRGLRLAGEASSRGFGPESGLPQGRIHGILDDDQGRLWISHSEGLARVPKQDLVGWLNDPSWPVSVAEFRPSDGLLLPGGSGSRPCAKGPDGRLWFGRRAGLIVADPSEIHDAPPPQVLVEQVTANGEEFPVESFVTDATPGAKVPSAEGSLAGPGNLQAIPDLKLPPGSTRRLEFEFTATSLHSPERVRFRFRLQGHDPVWRDAGSQRVARYQNLPAGRYTFQVRARNHEGRWSDRDALLGVQVAPYLWETGLFQIGAGAVLSGVLAGASFWGLRRQRRLLASRHQRNLEGERHRIARDLHDHLGASLTVNSMRRASRPSERGSVREPLQELNDLIWMVHPENDTLESLVGFIADHATRFLEVAGLAVRLDLAAELPEMAVPGAIRRELAALLKECLRNVVEHAGAAQVDVRIRVDRNQFLLTVEDDGTGFDASSSEICGSRPTGRGNGLVNLRSRCAGLGGECRVQSSPGEGTRVDFAIPLSTLRGNPSSA